MLPAGTPSGTLSGREAPLSAQAPGLTLRDVLQEASGISLWSGRTEASSGAESPNIEGVDEASCFLK